MKSRKFSTNLIPEEVWFKFLGYPEAVYIQARHLGRLLDPNTTLGLKVQWKIPKEIYERGSGEWRGGLVNRLELATGRNALYSSS